MWEFGSGCWVLSEGRWSADVALECEELPSAGVGAPIVARL